MRLEGKSLILLSHGDNGLDRLVAVRLNRLRCPLRSEAVCLALGKSQLASDLSFVGAEKWLLKRHHRRLLLLLLLLFGLNLV